MNITTRENFGHLAQTFYKTGIGAEIGVERGNFSRLILSQWKGSLLSVDLWEHQEIYAQAMKNLVHPRCTPVKLNSVEASGQTSDGSLDFVYIDADHDYSSCRQDLEAWFPKVRHGGLVAGHDYLNWTMGEGGGCDFGVKAAVDEFCVKHGYQLHVSTDDYWEGNPYPTWWFVKEIPRVIYYTWVGDKPLPEKFRQYIDGWRVVMPDYQIIEINMDNLSRTPFIMEALKEQKWCAVSNYVRCQKLYETGGIYMDADVEAVKRFDALLNDKLFAGCEKPHRVNCAVIGSMAKHPFLKECLEFMDRIVFHDPGPLGLEIETGPQLWTNLAKKYGWKEKDETQIVNSGELNIYDSKYFYPYYFDEKYHPGCVTENTYAVHRWAKNW